MTTSAASANILELRNLTKVMDHDLFKKKQTVIDDLSCSFPSGRCIGLLGHNGAGKTTTIRTIFGLTKATKGAVLFKGRPIRVADKAVLGYMPETNKLPMALTSAEILHYHLEIYPSPFKTRAERKAKIQGVLTEVGLWEHRQKKVAKLSKGMARRLAWAQATIHQPELVILDEPFSGLDPLGRQHMVAWVKNLKDTGCSIMLCTHELSSMYHLCDDFHILRRGALVYSTLDPVAGSAIPPEKMQQKWFLSISSANQEQLQRLQREHSLPTWELSHHEGYLSKLQFASYPAASIWLNACQQQNLVVLKFESSRGQLEEKILSYFDGGPS